MAPAVSILSIALATAACLWRSALGDCDRGALHDAADRFVAARSSGSIDTLVADGASYVENNKPTDLAGSVFAKPLAVAYNRSTADVVACATYTELIVTDPADPYVIGVQIRYNATGSDGASGDGSGAGLRVVLVDAVVSTTGSWLFNATQTLAYVLREDWGPVPAEQQDTRETLRAAADAYLDLWGPDSAEAAARVPWGAPCDRLEGSAYTGNGSATDSCDVGIPTGDYPPNTNRRYVVDETVGSVDVLCTFQTMRDAPDSHEFRLQGGKLRYVHTMTVCRCGQ